MCFAFQEGGNKRLNLKVAFLGLFCTALAHLWFVQSLEHIRAQVASVIATLEPVYGIAFAAILLREIPPARTVAGGVIILAAALLAAQTEQRTQSPQPQTRSS